MWVADRRFYWSWTSVSRSYNVRRQSSDQIVVGNQIETANVLEQEKYAEFSLFAEVRPWRAHEVLLDVLSRVDLGALFLENGSLLPSVPVEDLVIRGGGDSAVLQALAYMPGVSLYVHPDGFLRAFDTQDRSEEEALSGLAIHFPGEDNSRTVDWPIRADRRGVRPSAVRVLFDTQIEVKLRHDTSATVTDEAQTIPIRLTNVARSADASLTVDQKRVVIGSWAEIGDAAAAPDPGQLPRGLLRAWELDTTNSIVSTDDGGVGPLTQRLIREHYPTGFAYVAQYFKVAEGQANPVWAGRLNAIQGHWRLTYRLARHWWQRIQSIEPFRVAVFDEAHRARARSPVWMPHVQKPSLLGLVRGENESLQSALRFGASVDPFTVAASARPQSDLLLDVVDPAVGVVHVKPAENFTGERDGLLPGRPSGSLPSWRISEINRDPLKVLGLWDQLELSQTFEIETIVTAHFGAPNNESRLHAIELGPSDVAELLEVSPGDLVGAGPVLEVRIDPTIMRARFAWSDDLSPEAIRGYVAGTPMPEALLTNGDHLLNLARAAAAAEYEARLDRVETSGAEVPLNTSFVPTGGLIEVAHALRPDGATTTTLVAPKRTAAADPTRFLPPETQRVIFRSLPEN